MIKVNFNSMQLEKSSTARIEQTHFGKNDSSAAMMTVITATVMPVYNDTLP